MYNIQIMQTVPMVTEMPLVNRITVPLQVTFQYVVQRVLKIISSALLNQQYQQKEVRKLNCFIIAVTVVVCTANVIILICFNI